MRSKPPKRTSNLGEGRAEPRTCYAVLYAPTTEGRRAQRGTERSGVSSKNIFRNQLSDRLSSLRVNLIFFVLKNERGVRGEFHFSKHIIISYSDSSAGFHAVFLGIARQKMVLIAIINNDAPTVQTGLSITLP